MSTPAGGETLLRRDYSTGPLQVREDADGRSVTGVVVPYGVTADIIEPRPDGLIEYREQFARGAFERAQAVPDRVALLYTHADALPNWIGHGLEFVDTDDGLVGTFRLGRSVADHAVDVLTSSHSAFSVSFRSIAPRPMTERAGALVIRKSVHLAHVAAVPVGAYAGAGVVSIRAASDDDGETENERAARLAEQDSRDLVAWVAEARRRQGEWSALVSPQ